MNMKRLIATSVFALVAASSAQAADIMVPRQPEPTVPPVVVAPTFSWTGFYLGGQIGSFSGKTDTSRFSDGKTIPFDKEFSPKLSGFIGGFYAGSNVDLGNGLIFGVDTDIIWADKKDTRSKERKISAGQVDKVTQILEEFGAKIPEKHSVEGDILGTALTLKEKWAGATRARVGFAMDRIMPYIAGGVAYARMQAIASYSLKGADSPTVIASGDISDDKKTMTGYTIGGGVDFAVTDNVMMRAEYRYSDFGKKKFSQDKLEINHKTNDFRVGVAYKF
ncbi:hemin binding protein [Bartonella australis AUST/NH1]|uniref:Hemin binding protein n=1 Tax=Bartonella australis (strain Aust/NH1) TaxID=1094489 RepID=M1NRW1_BARAA|nr:outer membrane protein [Bartonella australis]AGF74073.1 hemin binding protein [Bartonella australis AUST/NH1]